MQQDEQSIFATGNVPSKDWFLQLLVNLANKNKFELDITLTVGGSLVAGTMAGVRQYFNELGAYFASPFASTMKSEEFKTTFKTIGEQCSCISPSEQTETPSYIHLKNATFFDATGRVTSGGQGVWWRGRLSEVQGFAPGLPAQHTDSKEGRKNC